MPSAARDHVPLFLLPTQNTGTNKSLNQERISCSELHHQTVARPWSGFSHGGGPVPSALSLILKKPRRSRRSGDELPPWRPAGHDVLKDNASGTTSPRGDMRILRIFKPSEPTPEQRDRRTSVDAAADNDKIAQKPVATKQQAAAAAAALRPGLRAPLGCIQNTLMQPPRQPAAPMQQHKSQQQVKRQLLQPAPRAEDRGALRPPPWVGDRSAKRAPPKAGAGAAAQHARNSNSRSRGLQQGGGRGTENMSGIPMYDPAAALSVQQQHQLYIIPAVARQQLSAGSSRPVHTSTPPRPSGADLLSSSPSSSPAAAAAAAAGGAHPLESGGGCSSLLLGGGPVELAALYEAGPGWRRSASASVSRVQVATRSSVKGGGTAARTARLTEAVSR